MPSHPNHIRPPAWPLKLLRFFVKREYVEEIEGDMEEIFYDNLEQFSLKKARRMYVWELLRLLRPVLVKNLEVLNVLTQHAMFKNYFKVSFRGLMKNPLSSSINVFGLAVAIGICLVVYTFMAYDRSIDQFHENKDNVYLTTFFADRDGVVQQYGTTPRPLGEVLKHDFAQIKRVCRVLDGNVVLKQDDNVFHESVRYVDPEFLQMFTFPLKWGTASSLADKSSIVLSEAMSLKYFGDENPIGRDVRMIFSEGISKVFTVTGVAAEFPKARAIEFNFLVNYENVRMADATYDDHDWSKFLNATLIQVDHSLDLTSIQLGMEEYRKLQNKAQDDWAISSFSFEPLATLHERSANIKDDISNDDNVEGRIGMPIIALFMLALACFNYINIAIVSAAKRLKEIGVRKVIGANRSRIIVQFLTENIFITLVALVLGFALFVFVFLPWFVQFTGWPLETKLVDKNLWIFLLTLLVFTGIASGIYPAFYISKFDTVKIFKGSLQFGRRNPLTKLFLGTQLILACITITAGVVFTQNNTYQNNLSWGYNQKHALFVNVPDQKAYEQLNALMLRDPNVKSVSGSADHLGDHLSTVVMHLPPNQHVEVNQLAVGAAYFETMELQLTEGRLFRENVASDKQAVVVSQLLVNNLNLAKPIGQVFEMDSARYEIVGVLKDFHTNNFFNKMRPTLFRLANDEDFRYLSLRVTPGSEKETHEALQKHWAKLYPEIPFQGKHQEDVWSNFFFSVNRSEKFNKVIASIAVLLASLGLYGLVTLNVSGRVKEFSIRKALGAGTKNIASVIVNQYVLLSIVAIGIGIPISYVFTKAYLDMLFAYPMPMGYSGVTLAVFILIVVLLTVISTQVMKVSKLNAASGLKAE